MITRPMLAEAIEELSQIQFPVLLTPKLDGIRCIKVNGKALTRKFLPLPNHHVREMIEKYLPDGVDGELVCVGENFNKTQSLLMSRDGKPDFEYCLFDMVTISLTQPYKERVTTLRTTVFNTPFAVKLVLPKLVANVNDFLRYEEQCIKEGYEGVMLRSAESPYKCGRATLKSGWLLKWKRFEDSEAQILGLIEAQENRNAKTVNELGLTKRSHAKAGKVAKGTLGTFKVRDINPRSSMYNAVFEIGTGRGLTAELRQRIWDNQSAYMGKIITYRFQPTGVKDKPRFPSFVGFRDTADIS